MTATDASLNQPIWRIIDHTTLDQPYSALDSFAIDDTLCASVGSKQSPPVARFWVHRRTVVLGIQDSRLPQIDTAVKHLRASGYDVIVRNSGGLAVVLDEGVLNISLVLPTDDVFANIDNGFEMMFAFVKQMLAPFQREVEAKEIVGSYCPGRYDLSIDDRKFGGISQRRTRGGVAVQVFLLASGAGKQRGELIRVFYRLATSPHLTGKQAVPDVRPETVASLSELLAETVDTGDLKRLAYDVLTRNAGRLKVMPLTTEEMAEMKRSREKMMGRNERIKRV